jgi:hypothetical protein
MNWRRLYATLQICFMVCLVSAATSGCYAVVVIGICRKVLGWSDNVSVFAVGLPAFIILLLVLIKLLSKPLRKAGMLSDEPEKFGPWFKKDSEP